MTTTTMRNVLAALVTVLVLVAPAAGVVVADYWVCRDRVVDRDALQTASATGAYAYSPSRAAPIGATDAAATLCGALCALCAPP